MPSGDATKTLMLQMRDGLQKRITIPAAWKVTFGPLVPGSKDGSVNSAGATALRLWSGSKGSEIQHAVFTNVESFRDMSIKIEEQVEEKRTETFRREGAEDGDEAIVADVKVKKWVNPDEETKVKSSTKTTPARAGALIELVKG